MLIRLARFWRAKGKAGAPARRRTTPIALTTLLCVRGGYAALLFRWLTAFGTLAVVARRRWRLAGDTASALVKVASHAFQSMISIVPSSSRLGDCISYGFNTRGS